MNSSGMSTTQTQRGERFAALHAGEAFVIPNPWDAGSARMLEALGFPALASTSSGFAFSLGRRDGAVTLDEVEAHTAAIAAVTDLPLSVDLENGYASDPDGVAAAVARVAGAGAVGASIEDFSRDEGLYGIEQAVERLTAAAAAVRDLGFPFLLTARAENHIRGNPDLDDTIARLQAYEQAGADVLYAPGLRRVEEIEAVCRSVSRPVNVLALGDLTREQIAGAGARRISVGGGLTWVAVDAATAAATAIRDRGDFSGLTAGAPNWLR
jgi:2-methylisocitrate lyase-like PEP mutase family enzyme